jgi:outer membrane protein
MRLSDKFFACVIAVISAGSSLPARAQDALSELDFAYRDSDPTDDSARSGNWRGFLGAGLVTLDRPMADRNAVLVPLVSISYRDTVYWNVGQGGVWLLKSDDRSARLGLALKARGGYDPGDFAGLAGMDKRRTSAEAGLNGTWRTQPVIVSFGFFTDVSDNSNGNSALLGLSHPFRLSDSWTLTPSVGAEWLSAEVVDYYYGVRPSEATPIRPAYAGQSSVNLRGALMAHYKLARAWSLFGGVSYTRLGAGITDSPIIIHDSVAALFVGGGWHF